MDKLMTIVDRDGYTVHIQTSHGWAAEICKGLLMYSDIKSVTVDEAPLSLFDKKELTEALGEESIEK